MWQERDGRIDLSLSGSAGLKLSKNLNKQQAKHHCPGVAGLAPPPSASPALLQDAKGFSGCSVPRLESRMSSDIHVILQLLQRQLSQVPPAYSPISPSSQSLAMYGIVPRSLEPLAPCAPLQDQELPTQEQVRAPCWLSTRQVLLPQSRVLSRQGTAKHSWVPAKLICPVHHFWGFGAQLPGCPITREGSGFLCSETSSSEKITFWGLEPDEERVWLLCFAFTITHTIPRFPPEPELHGGRKVPLEIQGLLVKWDAAVCVIRQNPDRLLRAGAPLPTSPEPRASPPKGTKHPGTLAGLSFPFPP